MATAWLDAAASAKRLAAYAEAQSHVAALLKVCDTLEDELERRRFAARAHAIGGDIEGLWDNLDVANEAYQKAIAVTPDADFRCDLEDCLHQVYETVSDGARIVYYVHGSGKDILLFVNPIVYGLALFQPVLERLCYKYCVVTVDCRGVGC